MNDDIEYAVPSTDVLPDVNRSAFRFPSPQAAMEFTGERFVSGLDGQIKHEHYHRYLFAARYCVDKDVLDVASGEGYGSVLLSQVARRVIGVDIDRASVDFANKTYLSNDVSFKQGNATDLPIATGSIDVVISFETIEHFADQDRFIAEVARVLRPGGLLVISSPNKPVYDSQNPTPNPFHVHELCFVELIDMLRRSFAHVAVCEQRALHGSVILPTDHLKSSAMETFEADDGLLFVREAGLANPAYFLAVASTVQIPNPHGSFLHNGAHVLGLHAALDQLSRQATEARGELSTITARHDKELARAVASHNEELAQATARYDEELAQATARYDEELAQATARYDENLSLAVRDKERYGATMNMLRSELTTRTHQIARLNDELRAVRRHLGLVLTSTSWVLSGPIRAVGYLRQRPNHTLRDVLRIGWWSVTLRLRARMREQRRIRLFYMVGGFDSAYYLRRYPDVAAVGIDPALHYWRCGAGEGRDPSAEFSTAAYRSRHPELSLETNPLLDAILTGRLADGRLQQPRASAPPALTPPTAAARAIAVAPAIPRRDLSTLVYVEHRNPAITIIIDARVPTPAVEQTLRAISAEGQNPAGELFVLVTAGSNFAFAGARRVIVESGPALAYVGSVLEQSRAPVAILIDGGTAVEEATLATGLAMFFEADNVAVVCALRQQALGEVADAGLCLNPDGSFNARGSGLPVGHYEVASVSPVDSFTPGFFMFDKASWEAVGGISSEFDTTTYAAADLSMRLRAAGKQILYQPLMRATVFTATIESVSALTDDLEKLFGRWGAIIENAKRHARPRMLFVDHFTPTPDRDAGSNVLYWYMRIFQNLGYRVTFLPTIDLTSAGNYTSDLQRQGIECISMPGVSTAEQYLRENAAMFHGIMLYRAPVAFGYTDLIRSVAPMTRIIYNTVDLHFLREEREAALLPSAEKFASARATKQIEIAAVRKADCTIVLSQVEHEILQKLVPEAYKQFIPLTQPIPGCEAPYGSRDGIVFVGGFSHRPNVDAVQHLTRHIWPLVRGELPDVRLIIAGSGVTDEVRSFGDPGAGIEIRGFVPDLTALLRTCRLTVAPLRYGAGMKGKVVNSLAHGVPCVTTTVGAEGTGLVADRDILVADEPSLYAKAVVAAYTDPELWGRLSANGVAFAQENLSIAQVTKAIQGMLRTLGLPVQSGLKPAGST